jgi:hypothetical protein
MHPFALLHVIAVAGVAIWWSLYFWHHTPARDLLLRTEPPSATRRRSTSATISDRAAGELARHVRDASSALALAGADVAGGLFVLSLFAVGTGIYVRRFEVWLQARNSGETMTFAGTGLDDRALAANRSRDPGR